MRKPCQDHVSSDYFVSMVTSFNTVLYPFQQFSYQTVFVREDSVKHSGIYVQNEGTEMISSFRSSSEWREIDANGLQPCKNVT